jgi:hypothetical protein
MRRTSRFLSRDKKGDTLRISHMLRGCSALHARHFRHLFFVTNMSVFKIIGRLRLGSRGP